MKAISLWQPHASLVPLRLKRHETRSWGTSYRGPLLICSAKRNQKHQHLCWLSIIETMESLDVETSNLPCWDELPFGCAICVVNLADCIKMTPAFIAEQTESERLVGDCQSPDYDDESGEELYEENEVAAELVFPCCECNHSIKAGEKYRHIKGCWDGDWSTYRMCLSCSRVSDRFVKEINTCHRFGGLYDELINSDILCRDEFEREVYFCSHPWLKIISQYPLRCDAIEVAIA